MLGRLTLKNLSILSFTSLVAACASYQAHPTPLKDAEAYAAHTSANGLSIGADIYDNAEKCSRAFDEDISRTFTPVQVVVDNRADQKFLIDRAHAILECSDGTSLMPVSSAMAYNQYRSDVVGASMVTGRLGAAAATDANDAKRADWAEKEFPSQVVVEPTRRVGGFLYFRGRCPGRFGHRTLRFDASGLASNDTVAMEVRLR
jgi:hypothetical protein